MFVRAPNGKILFKMDVGKVITNYPLVEGDDMNGAVQIIQHPYVDEKGSVPEDMYIVCNDPYAHDGQSVGQSLGSTFVIKSSNQLSPNLPNCIVAEYTARPSTQDEYNNQLFMIAEYYNAKIAFENDRGEVISYARRNKKLKVLVEQFEMLHKKELRSKKVKREYGMHMTAERKLQGELYIRDWLLEIIKIDEEGNEVSRLSTIHNIALLKELLKYSYKGNFDRVSCLIIGMYNIKENAAKKIIDSGGGDDKLKEFFNRSSKFFKGGF
jgi:hypothetical protein